jgi:hypothetical protein
VAKQEDQVASFFGGIIIIFILSTYFYFTSEETSEFFWDENTSTLSSYKKATSEERKSIVNNTLNKNGWKFKNNIEDYISCMGDFAYHKSENLKYKEVVKWCFNEENNNKEKFISHYNQLDEKDLSTEAIVLCQNLVEERLLSPSTADFPFFDRKVWAKGHQEYKIVSYVDSQNENAVMVRTRWNCNVKYRENREEEDPLIPINWKLIDLSFF